MKKSITLVAGVLGLVSSEVYFKEDFTTFNRWVQSEWKSESERAPFKHTTGDIFVDKNDKGIQTKQDAKFYAISAKMDKPINNLNKDLYLSYLVKFEQDIDCGGAYIKLLPSNTDQKNFGGDAKYSIMFGPDICGATRRTHAILHYKRPNDKEGKNMDHFTDIRAEKDQNAHLYTFVLKKDNTYDVLIDGKSVQKGTLAENWPFQPEKEIKDPSQSKPDDWVDEAKIPDPKDKKPKGWDDIPRQIPDPDAKKPEDWDEEDDGEWEPAMIDNPEYKGPWQPRMIDNPKYKGEWKHPMISNPDYFEDDKMYNVCKDCGVIGFELWQVKSGTFFDDILVTDDKEVYQKHEKAVLEKATKLNDKVKEKEEEEEKKRKEEAEKRKKEMEKKREGDDDEEEEEEEEEEKEDKEEKVVKDKDEL